MHILGFQTTLAIGFTIWLQPIPHSDWDSLVFASAVTSGVVLSAIPRARINIDDAYGCIIKDNKIPYAAHGLDLMDDLVDVEPVPPQLEPQPIELLLEKLKVVTDIAIMQEKVIDLVVRPEKTPWGEGLVIQRKHQDSYKACSNCMDSSSVTEPTQTMHLVSQGIFTIVR
jgi:hypothetical protein